MVPSYNFRSFTLILTFAFFFFFFGQYKISLFLVYTTLLPSTPPPSPLHPNRSLETALQTETRRLYNTPTESNLKRKSTSDGHITNINAYKVQDNKGQEKYKLKITLSSPTPRLIQRRHKAHNSIFLALVGLVSDISIRFFY